MGKHIKVRGVIVGETPMGEQDKRVTILTKEAGRLQTIAKGAKSPKGKLSGSTQLFYYGDFLLEKGRSFYYIREAQIIESFYAIRQDFEKLAWGAFMVELASALALDGQENRELLRRLLRGLQALTAAELAAEAVAMAFALRAVSDNGFRPQTDRCGRCGREVDGRDGWTFLVRQGAMVCPACRGQYGEATAISASVAKALAYIVNMPLERMYRFSMVPEYRRELSRIVEDYVQTHTGQTFTSLDFVKRNFF